MIAERNTAVRETLPASGNVPRVESRALGPGVKVHTPPVRPATPPEQPQLSARELKRRLWHISPGLLPFVLWFIPHRDPFSWDLKGGALAVIGVLGISILRQFKNFKRSEQDDQGKLGAVLGYALPVTLMMLLLPAWGELAFTVLAVLAFGDGFATLGGLWFRGPRLPWNWAKTWSGLACFLVCATVMGSVIYWGEAKPRIPYEVALQIAALTTVIAAISETIPSRINDNIRVGITACGGVILSQWLLVGF